MFTKTELGISMERIVYNLVNDLEGLFKVIRCKVRSKVK